MSDQICGACGCPRGSVLDCAFCSVENPTFHPRLPPPILVAADDRRLHRLAWGTDTGDYLTCTVCGLGWEPSATFREILRPCAGVRLVP